MTVEANSQGRGRRRYLSPASFLHNVRQPRQLRIGVRLTFCFVTIVVLMVASYAFTLWQFDRVRAQEEKIHNLDLTSHAVLNMHASLLILRDKLDDLARAQDPRRFPQEAGNLRRQFMTDADRANQALKSPNAPVAHDPTMLGCLETVESALPAQIDALTDLATLGDWVAVRFRLDNQLRPLSSLTSSLVEKVDLEVAGERSRSQQAIQRLERRVLYMHALTALLSLLIATLLGVIITRSITQPLAQLDTGAKALAIGDFQHRVDVEGHDELTTLGRVFNDATQRLSDLYGALKSGEERLRSVVAAAPVGIAVLDTSSSILMFNPKFLEIVGFSREEASKRRLDDPVFEVLREDDTPCPIPERPSQRAIATGLPVLDMVLKHHRVGSEELRWVLTSAWPILAHDASVEQVVLTLTDITEQKEIEMELRSGRELLDQAQRAAHMGSFDLDLKSNSVRWSPELAELFGFPPGTVIGTHGQWEQLVLPEDLEHAQKNVALTMKTGESVAEYRIRRQSDGEIRWVESRARVFYDDDGHPLRLVGLTMDITERMKAEEALRRSEQEFHIIFDNAAIGMVLLDTAGHLLRSNPAFCRLIGYAERELSSMTFEGITHPDDLVLSRSMYRDLIDGRRDRYQIKKRYVHKDGTVRSGRLTVSSLRTEAGAARYCVAMVEDITKQEQTERTLLQMSERLLHIQEEEQRRIAREVHDSTSQEMTALTLNLGALKAVRHTLPEKVQKQVEESLALAKRVAREIRTFSYLLHPPLINELGLWSALRMFVEEFRDRSGLQVTLKIPSELGNRTFQPNQEMAIFRFVQEALANVHRHSGSATADISLALKNRDIEVSVSDTGCGFPADLLKEIEASGGVAGGVGLSGMHERIGYVGGRVRIQSNENATTVSATVPLEYQPVSTAEALKPPKKRDSTPFPLSTAD